MNIAPLHRHDLTDEYLNKLLNFEQFIIRYMLVPRDMLGAEEHECHDRLTEFTHDLYQEWLDMKLMEIGEDPEPHCR